MTNADMARSHLRQARVILEEAERYRQARQWHLVVRRAQECVELALTAVLRTAGIEVPHVHDVGIFLVEYRERLPDTITRHLDRLVSTSRRLRREREISFYGDEEVGAPPERLYVAADGESALADARFVLEACEAGIREGLPGRGP